MKAQDQQGCSRKMVYEALSRFTVMYGITFGRMKMTLSDLDGALIDIRYQDVVQIIETIPYVGIVLRTGYLYVFMQIKDKPIVINLHTVNTDRLFHDTITRNELWRISVKNWTLYCSLTKIVRYKRLAASRLQPSMPPVFYIRAYLRPVKGLNWCVSM